MCRPSSSGPTQTWPKFGPGMGRARRVGPVVSHSCGGCWQRADPVRRVRMSADAIRRPAGNALSLQNKMAASMKNAGQEHEPLGRFPLVFI
jgi:hypothetical protein